MRNTSDIVAVAGNNSFTIPAFNICYLPMMEPVVQALRDTRTLGMIAVARPDWTKFQAGGPADIAREYARVGDPKVTWLHLDHVPVIDEDNLKVDYVSIIRQALDLGYQSVMIDGSRLPLDGNIEATRRIADMAHAKGVLVEAELGAVLGHEEGPLPPYEELFASGQGFTDPGQAEQFSRRSGADWLSVAVGNIHGAVSRARKDQKKVTARLSIERIRELRRAAGVPLVLHGGSGIDTTCLQQAIGVGIAKVNIATSIRQPYERALSEHSVYHAQAAVYDATIAVVRDELAVAGSADRVNAHSPSEPVLETA